MLFLCLRKRSDPSRVRRPSSSSASTRDLPPNSRYCLFPTSRYRYWYQRQHPTSLCRKPPQGQSVNLFRLIPSEKNSLRTIQCDCKTLPSSQILLSTRTLYSWKNLDPTPKSTLIPKLTSTPTNTIFPFVQNPLSSLRSSVRPEKAPVSVSEP